MVSGGASVPGRVARTLILVAAVSFLGIVTALLRASPDAPPEAVAAAPAATATPAAPGSVDALHTTAAGGVGSARLRAPDAVTASAPVPDPRRTGPNRPAPFILSARIHSRPPVRVLHCSWQI